LLIPSAVNYNKQANNNGNTVVCLTKNERNKLSNKNVTSNDCN